MSSWTIYGANGVAKAVVKELELHDEWMAECFVTVTVKSHEPIDFEIGDYIDYRDERYSINYDPTILKKARRDTYGEGFTYDNIKFVAVQDEIVRCDFNDIVLSDNNIHYTMLPTFPFYCENVEDLLDRVQANLEELYPGGWIIIGLDRNRARQRGLCVGRQQAFLDAYSRYIGDVEFEYEKTGVALTADNNNCWEALKWANEQFDLNFFVRGRVVVVGTNGAVTGRKFRYGKGNGLYEIERISDSEQKIITRLRGYGAETNLPDRYYANLGKRCFATITDISSDGIYYILDIKYKSSLFKVKDSEGNHYVTKIEREGEYDWANVYVLAYDHEDTITSDGYTVIYPQTGVTFSVGQKIYFIEGIDVNAWPAADTEQATQYLPDNMAINRLMLPGFPTKSLAEWVEEHMDNEKVAAIVEEGFTFSDDVMRPYIDSPNKETLGIRPASIYFDGNGDNEDIHPTIEGMEWNGERIDIVYAADKIEDNGYISEENSNNESAKRFNITIPYSGFNLADEFKKDETTISMKDGMCGARNFKVMKQPTQDADTKNWICVCERQYDETLKIYFPYRDFQIYGSSEAGHSGDHYVLTGIDLPDSYIEAASEKLFFACVDALRANHAPRYTFQPRIDEIWMQRQHDTAVASGGAVESLHDTLKSGDLFSFADDDLGIDAKIIIDILTIKENGNNGIPTYEVTLRDEKIASALDKRLDKITSVISSGVGGGMTSRQYSGMIEAEGSDLFLSKIYDDVAQGVIGFLKGVWFGVKQWFIDSDGNANLNDTTVNGLLKAYNATINNVRSSNYTGDGMMDSGWRITNEYDGANSKATFDFLYIRKKAIFEELEIRKLSHIGGNFVLSGASGRAWKVDYYDANGNLLGYDTYTVPWTLFGRIMTLFKPHNANNRYLGKRKQIQRRLTDAEMRLVRTCRVYMYNDDGTTETMNNWTVGAQARCQTFNVEKQMEFDGSSWTGTKVGNTYWYRYVTAVSTNPVTLEDGQKHHYVEFSVDISKEPWLVGGTGGEAYAWADVLSDLPSKGDVFVQLGHRTRQDQSNVIMLETANDDSPSIKMYAGVNWWTYADKLVAIESPNGWRIVSNKFEWITEYGERFQTTVNRGVWVEITPDEQGKRKCYYNDMVSHNGAYWRCIVGTGSYTTDEPSESSSAWSKEVYAAIAPYVKLSEALVAIPCEKDSVTSEAFSKTIVPKLMLTNLECTLTSVILEGADSNVYKDGNNINVNFAAGASVTNKDYTVTLEGDRDGNHYVATDKLSVYAIVRGNDGYEVTTEPNIFLFTQNESDPFAINIDKSETGNSSMLVKVMNDGISQAFRITNVTCYGWNSAGQAVSGVTATYSNTSGRVWITNIPNNVEKGQVVITISYGNASQYTLTIPFYCNLIGTWKETVIGDTKTAIAEQTVYYINETDKAKAQFEADLTSAVDELNQTITANETARDTTDQIMKDGLITDEEKAVLRSLQKSLKNEYDEAVSAYATVYNDDKIDATNKTALKAAYDEMGAAYTDVQNKITELLDLTTISKNGADAVNTTFNTFNTKLKAYGTALENASSSIVNKVNSNIEAAKTELNQTITANETARDASDKIMSDGLITDDEKGVLRSLRKTLVSEYGDTVAAYSPIYNNTNLNNTTEKTALATAKGDMDTAYTAVIAKIDELLALTEISKDGADAVNTTFDTFKAKMDAYRTALENASNKIVSVGDAALGDQYTTFHAEYVQNSQQQTAKFTAITTALTGSGSDDDTPAIIQQRMATYQQGIDGAFTEIDNGLGDRYTKSETANLINTKISDNNGNYYTKTETADLVSSEVASGTLSTNIDNIDEWEQGTTNEVTGRTYAQIKADSSTRIRTKKLFPSTDQLCVIMSSNAESWCAVGFVYFTIDKVVCSTTFSGWKTMAQHGTDNKRIEVSGPNDCAYIAVLVRFQNEGNITPTQIKDTGIAFISKQTATRSYVIQKADEISLGVETEIEGKLYNTGIDITGSTRTINLFGDKINFYKSYSSDPNNWEPANITFDQEAGIYKFSGWLIAHDGATIDGNDIKLDASGGNGNVEIKADNDISLDADYDITIGRANNTRYVTVNCTQFTVNQNTDINGDLGISGDVSISGNTIFSSKATMNSGAEVTGALQARGAVAFSDAFRTESFTLPEYPIDGQIYFMKGRDNNLVLSARQHAVIDSSDSSEIVSAWGNHNFGDDACFVIFSDIRDKWYLFRCWN